MGIDTKKYDSIHGKTGDSEKRSIKDKFDENMHTIAVDHPDDFPELAAVVYQIGQLEEEIDYLRGLISTNKDKATFPGLGTSSSTALAGNTTVISSGQASAIAANTSKTGISSGQATAITANTAKKSLVGGTGTALSFGEMIETIGGRGKPTTYSIVMTAVKVFKGKSISKSVTLTLI